MTQQLDFLGTPTQTYAEQPSFWDSNFDLNDRHRNIFTPSKVDKFFQSIDSAVIKTYSDYWKGITPNTDSEIFRRWLFAFLSVHTTWENNVKGYLLIRNWWEWLNNDAELEKRIIASGAGLQKNRVRYISTFAHNFWGNPDKFKRQDSETWQAFRNRLVKDILGLGMAKVSFSLEMITPLETGVVCLDTHLFQVYGLDQTTGSKHYEDMERHWLEMSKMWNVSPYVARCIWWDKNQNKEDSRYWSFTLEA